MKQLNELLKREILFFKQQKHTHMQKKCNTIQTTEIQTHKLYKAP